MSTGTTEALRLLIAERDRLNQAIAVLSRAEASGPSPDAEPAAKKRRGRPPMTLAQKKAQSEKMKAYWAKRRKARK